MIFPELPGFIQHPLPIEAARLCDVLNAPPRLRAHLTLVHDVAVRLVEKIAAEFPNLEYDREAVLFGAATHDLGKAVYRAELRASGHQHELEGPRILENLGVSPERARFAFTHAAWKRDPPPELTVEDLLVALADQSWKGNRPERLENLVREKLGQAGGGAGWEIHTKLDDMLETLTRGADERLLWMGQF